MRLWPRGDSSEWPISDVVLSSVGLSLIQYVNFDAVFRVAGHICRSVINRFRVSVTRQVSSYCVHLRGLEQHPHCDFTLSDAPDVSAGRIKRAAGTDRQYAQRQQVGLQHPELNESEAEAR